MNPIVLRGLAVGVDREKERSLLFGKQAEQRVKADGTAALAFSDGPVPVAGIQAQRIADPESGRRGFGIDRHTHCTEQSLVDERPSADPAVTHQNRASRAMSLAVVVNWPAGRSRLGTEACATPRSKCPIAMRGSPAAPVCVVKANVLSRMPKGCSSWSSR